MARACGNFTKFTGSNDDPNLGTKWSDWLERFENEIVAWDVTSKKQQKALLISYAGDIAWEKWKTCTAAEKGDDSNYDQAKKTLSDYFDRKKDPDFEIKKFRECKQHEGESIDAYVTRLRNLSKHCGFGDNRDKEIKLQIKLNCVSPKLRRRAFAEPKWKLDDLVKFARALELSEHSSYQRSTPVRSKSLKHKQHVF